MTPNGGNGQLGWGIIGPGRIAVRIARALVDNPRGRLLAVASRDRERGAAFAARHADSRSAVVASGRATRRLLATLP